MEDDKMMFGVHNQAEIEDRDIQYRQICSKIIEQKSTHNETNTVT